MSNLLEDFLLLAAGGIVGLATGVALCSEDEEDEGEEKAAIDPVCCDVDAVREAAHRALASCRTEEERDAVRAQIHQSIDALQEDLDRYRAQAATAGEEAVAEEVTGASEAFATFETDLGARPAPEESVVDANVQTFQKLVTDIQASLGEMLEEKRSAISPHACS